MKIPAFKKISTQDMRGLLIEDMIPILPPSFFENPIHFVISKGGRVVSESKWRWAGIFSFGGKNIFIKRDKTKGGIEYLKYIILPSKGRREYFISYQIKKRNIPIPNPIGWLERYAKGLVVESYYISEAIVSGTPLSHCQSILKDERVLSTMVKTLLKIHRSGLYHQDLHAGNLIWDGESFFILDLHRAKIIKYLSLNQRLLNIASLLHSLREVLEEREQLKFIEEYFQEGVIHANVSQYFKKIRLLMDSLQSRQWESRTKRCLKESTNFSINRNNHNIIYHRREFGVDVINELLKNHLEISQKDPARLIKKDKRSLISCLSDGDTSIYIKQFYYPSLLKRLTEFLFFSKGMRAWIGGNGLKVRGILSILPFVLLRQRQWLLTKQDFLFMEGIKGGLEMDRYILNYLNSLQVKRRFIKTFASWLSNLHQKKVYHKDMKTCNIIVRENEGKWEFYLLDLEDVRLQENVSGKKLLKNLIQLNTSIPKIITQTDRLRFLKEYLKLHPIVKHEKTFLKKVIIRSKRRGVVFVSSMDLIDKRNCG